VFLKYTFLLEKAPMVQISSPLFKPSDYVNRYSPIRKIENGSTSTLYVCEDKKTQKKVVMKKIRRTSNWGDELHILHKLKETETEPTYGVIGDSKKFGILDSFITERHVNIVTPYIDSYNLAKYVANNAPYSENDTLYIFKKMLECVKKIHDVNIIHLDIKCENFLVVPRSGSDVDIVLIDYGHSELLNPKFPKYIHYGTPKYLCPEGRIHNIAGKPSDVWSLGICLSILLTGEYPFDLDPYDKTYLDNVNGNLKSFDQVSQRSKAILKMMLYKDPSNRITIDHLLENSFITG
jgi:serine/threonine protein kinase